MSTPNIDSRPSEADALHLGNDSDKGKNVSAESDWVSTASFIFGGIAAVGFLLVVFGEYLASSLVVVLVGTAVISLGGIAWGFAALVLVFRLVKRWFTSDAIVHK